MILQLSIVYIYIYKRLVKCIKSFGGTFGQWWSSHWGVREASCQRNGHYNIYIYIYICFRWTKYNSYIHRTLQSIATYHGHYNLYRFCNSILPGLAPDPPGQDFNVPGSRITIMMIIIIIIIVIAIIISYIMIAI